MLNSTRFVTFAVCLSTLLCAGIHASVESTIRGFPDVDTITNRASLLHQLSSHVGEERVFPSMTFKCTGRVSSWTFVIACNTSSETSGDPVHPSDVPVFKIWRHLSGTHYVFVRVEPQRPLRSTVLKRTGQLCLVAVQYKVLNFQDGDILGIDQRLTSAPGQAPTFPIQYQLMGGPTNLDITGAELESSTINFQNAMEATSDYPLVAIDTDCASGFLSKDALMRLLDARSLRPSSYRSGIWLFDASIEYSGVITKWTIGANRPIFSTSQRPPELQRWRCTSNSEAHTCELLESSELTEIEAHPNLPNVYCTSASLTFEEEDDVLSFYQPPLQNTSILLYSFSVDDDFESCNFRDTEHSEDVRPPAIGDSISLSDDHLMCQNQLPLLDIAGSEDQPLSKLAEIAGLIGDLSYGYGRLRVFPSARVTFQGHLTAWTFAAKDEGAGSLYPQLQILRPNRQKRQAAGRISYTVVNSTDGQQPFLSDELNTYYYDLDDPWEVKDGDILAIYQPHATESRLSVPHVGKTIPADFEVIGGLDGVPVDVGSDANGVIAWALVSAEVTALGFSVTPTPLITTPLLSYTEVLTITDFSFSYTVTEVPTITDCSFSYTVTFSGPSSSPVIWRTPTIDTDEASHSDDTQAAAIAGAALASVAVILVALLIGVAVLYIILGRRKQKKAKLSGPTMTNDVTTHHNPTYLGGSPLNGNLDDAADQPEYETIAHARPQLGDTVAGQPQYEIIAQEHPLSEASSLAGSPAGSPAREYEVPLVTPSTPQHHIYHTLEQAGGDTVLYVPTEEERKSLKTSSSGYGSIYATLEQNQRVLDQHFVAGSCFEESDTYWRPASNAPQLYQQLASRRFREIPDYQIRILDHLGSGHFGTVSRGVWEAPSGPREVAVKALHQTASPEDRVRFLQEAAINGQFQHPNVVKLYGVVTLGEPVMIVLEFLAEGDLKNYLRKIQEAIETENDPPPKLPEMLLAFCRQIAVGMEYLSNKGFVHRDLAARNILLAEDKTCKISDFGMARDLEEETYYVSQSTVMVPVKWTAPEALRTRKFSSASDVWSYGAVLYEIWSLGAKPFSGFTNAETVQLVDSGYRLPPPPGCPKELYKLMMQCWHPDPSSRPTFPVLAGILQGSEEVLLAWADEEEDTASHTLYAVLGASLEAGKELYAEVQHLYIHA